MPMSVEELRTKYAIMSNMWLLGQMRQPGRSLYSDLSKETFPNFLEIHLSKKNFIFRRVLPDKTLAGRTGRIALSVNSSSVKKRTA